MGRWRFQAAATLVDRIVKQDGVAIVCEGWDPVDRWTVVVTVGTMNVGGSQGGEKSRAPKRPVDWKCYGSSELGPTTRLLIAGGERRTILVECCSEAAMIRYGLVELEI